MGEVPLYVPTNGLPHDPIDYMYLLMAYSQNPVIVRCAALSPRFGQAGREELHLTVGVSTKVLGGLLRLPKSRGAPFSGTGIGLETLALEEATWFRV